MAEDSRKQAMERVDAADILAYVERNEDKSVDLLKDTGHRSPRPAFRVVDTRLQALRKAGRIEFASAIGWRLTDAERFHG